MDWAWRNAGEAQAFVGARLFEKATLAGVAVDRGGSVYVTTPRWLDPRIPSTLNRVVTRDGRTVLEPFPSWEANAAGEARTFRNVLGIKVDSRNRLWALDMGFVAGSDAVPDGAQKLVVIDLDSGRELRRYEIPDSVANRATSFLNDMAIDEVNELAYISDSGNRSGAPTASGIVVYDFRSNTARRVLDRHPSVQNDAARPLVVNGEPVFPGNPLAVGINGVALTPDGTRLFWGITTGDAVYSVPTDGLRDPSRRPEAVAAAVSAPVRIGGGSDGLTFDSRGRLWITNLALNRVQTLDPATGTLHTVSESLDHIWPDSFHWDDRGGLLFTSNHLNRAFAGSMSFDGAPNFKIWRLQTDAVRPQRQAAR
jgi:sugar lactone lactonase YvrE